MLRDEMLKEAYRSYIKARALGHQGDIEAAENALRKSRNLYQKVFEKTEPEEQIGRRARIGLIKTTYELDGLEKATTTLSQMLSSGDITPRNFDELKIYLGVK